MPSALSFGRFASSVVAETARRWSSGIAGDAADTQGLPSAFPWREAPDHRVRGFVSRIGHAFRQHNRRKIRQLSDESFLVSDISNTWISNCYDLYYTSARRNRTTFV